MDVTTLSDNELRARLDELYPLTQVAGCPREVVLEYQALEDEVARRPEPEGVRVLSCGDGEADDGAEWDQPPGPEWGA